MVSTNRRVGCAVLGEVLEKSIGRMRVRSEAEDGSARGGVLNHPPILVVSVAVLAQALFVRRAKLADLVLQVRRFAQEEKLLR